MFGCYDTVTLWRRKNGDNKDNEIFEVSVIPVKCKWRSRENRVATENGAISKRYVTVIVPYENGYKFNGKVGDYMALGRHKTKITGEQPHRVNDVKEALNPDFMQITYIKDSTRSTMGRKWRAEGVV